MKKDWLSPFRYIWKLIVSVWIWLTTPAAHAPVWHYLPEPVRAGFGTFVDNHKEFVTLLQRMVGISPTEGRELTQDLRLVKCHSGGLGAPRASTCLAPSPNRRVELVLSHQQTDAAPDDWAVEEIRSLTRSIISDIVASRR